MNAREAVTKLRWLAVFGYEGCDNKVSKDDLLNIAYLIEEQDERPVDYGIHRGLYSEIKDLKAKIVDLEKLVIKPRTIRVKPGDKIISPDGTEATFVKWGLM